MRIYEYPLCPRIFSVYSWLSELKYFRFFFDNLLKLSANVHPVCVDDPDKQVTAGEVGTKPLVMYSYGPLHVAKQKQGDQLEPTYSSSVRTLGVTLRTCQKRCPIGMVRDIRADGTIRWWDDDLWT